MDRVLSEVPDSKVTMMSTFNLLSVTSYLDFLKDMLELKLRYSHQTKRQIPLAVDVPYLRHPDFLAAWVLTENYLDYIGECVTFMYRNQEFGRWYPLATKGFFEHEIHRMERLYYLVSKQMGVNKPENIEQRRNFGLFIDEYDKRRGTNFTQTFPELEDFYRFCKI